MCAIALFVLAGWFFFSLHVMDDGMQRLSTIGEICCHHLLLAIVFHLAE